MSSLDPDWQFYILLAATALAVAGVVSVYSFLTYRRSIAAEARRDAHERASAGEGEPEPVFFKRWHPGAVEASKTATADGAKQP